jgi:hypothetical protein
MSDREGFYRSWLVGKSGILSGITCRFNSHNVICLFILESGNRTGNESTPYQPELDGTAAAARRRAETA